MCLSLLNLYNQLLIWVFSQCFNTLSKAKKQTSLIVDFSKEPILWHFFFFCFNLSFRKQNFFSLLYNLLMDHQKPRLLDIHCGMWFKSRSIQAVEIFKLIDCLRRISNCDSFNRLIEVIDWGLSSFFIIIYNK